MLPLWNVIVLDIASPFRIAVTPPTRAGEFSPRKKSVHVSATVYGQGFSSEEICFAAQKETHHMGYVFRPL